LTSLLRTGMLNSRSFSCDVIHSIMISIKKNKGEQILELIKKSTSLLICLPEHPTTDAITSGLALASIVEKLGKRSKVVSSGFQLPQNHSFLPKSNEIFNDISALRQFIISVDVSKISVEELSYTIEGDALKIYISPKDGYFTEKNVSTESSQYAFDLIVTLDAHTLESIGKIFELNTEFFYHTPIINIDHSPENNSFGNINLLNVTATSTSELLFELIKEWGDHLLDEYIATNLLTGMISKTKSFRAGSVTPRSLAIASHLISQGARREEIVRNLYQSKKVSTLRLWGRALSKLETKSEQKIVWSKLTPEDFTATGASAVDLPDVIDELIVNTPEAQHVFILYSEPEDGVHAAISTATYINALEIFSDLFPKGSEHFITFSSTQYSMEQMERLILERLQKIVPKT